MDRSPISCPFPPFHSAESAWFWVMRSLQTEPIRASSPGRPRIEDVIKCLDVLYRHRRIDLLHVRILRIWGRRGVAPNPGRARERSDWRIWREAIDRLDDALRARGIVAGAVFQDAAD